MSLHLLMVGITICMGKGMLSELHERSVHTRVMAREICLSTADSPMHVPASVSALQRGCAWREALQVVLVMRLSDVPSRDAILMEDHLL